MATPVFKSNSTVKTLFLWSVPTLFLVGFVLRLFFIEVGASSIQVLAQSYFVPCIFHWITDLDCPGCGITRSLLSFILWSPYWSFYFHPMGPALGVALLVFWLSLLKPKNYSVVPRFAIFLKRHNWSVLILVLAWGFLRNL